MRFTAGGAVFTVRGMNEFSAMVGAMARGIDVLAGFNRQDAVAAGLPMSWIREWDKAHQVYFGRTKWTRQQRVAVDKARESGMSLSQLVLIEQRIRHIQDDAERWQLRHSLLDVRGTYDTLNRAAKDIVPAKEKEPPKPGMRFTGSAQGFRSFTVVAPERRIADLEFAVSQGVRPDRPQAEQKLEKFLELIDGDQDSHVPRAVPRPLVLVPLPDYTKILGQQGDETVLGLTDGTTMTGAEFLTTCAGAELEIALFHPQEGPVNLYRGQRLANDKQRALVSATQPICAVPDCRHAADMCEMHHIEAWKNGGPTNLHNLAAVCRYHNRTNDDDAHRGRHHRGRIATIRGTPTWISPNGYRVRNTRHPYGAMHTLFGHT